MVTMSACRHDAVPRRLAGPWPITALGRRQLRLVAAALVLRQGAAAALRLRLAAGHAAPAALRPVHAVRLEGAAADQPGLDPGPGRPAGPCEDWDTPRHQVARHRRSPVVRPAGRAALAGSRKPQPSRRSQEQVGSPAARAASRCRRWICRYRRARGPRAWSPSGSRPTSARRAPDSQGGVTWARSPDRSRASASPSRTCSGRSSPPTTRSSRRSPAPRYHGRHILNRHPDGLEKCIGCELCAWACPADAIYVEGGDNTEEQRFSPG